MTVHYTEGEHFVSSRHLFLWPLAEVYFREAEKTLQHNGVTRAFSDLLTGGLRCLYAVLLDSTVEPRVELFTRKRICELLLHHTQEYADAEAILNRAMLIAKQHNFVEEKFSLQLLLARIFCKTSPRAAKVLLLRCIKEAEEYAKVMEMYGTQGVANAHKWVYEFYLCSSSFQSVQQLSKNIYNYANDHNHQEMALLALILNQDLPMEEIPTRTHQLAVLVLITQIVKCINEGKILKSREKLNTVHMLLESDTLKWGSSHIDFTIDGETSIYLRWLSINQIYILAYLISGVCYLPETSSGRASRFLQEGLRISGDFVPHETSVNRYFETDQWFDSIIDNLKCYLVAAHLSRSKFSKAEKILFSSAVEQNDFRNLLHGMLKHKKGKFEEAESIYRLIIKKPDTPKEIFILSTLNLVNLLQDSTEASHSLEWIEKSCKEQKNLIYTLWWMILKISRENAHVQKTNSLLKLTQHSIDLSNTQLQYIVFTELCTRLGNIEQAEKMASSALTLAKKSKDDIWSFFSGTKLELLYQDIHDFEKLTRQKEENTNMWKEIQNFFS
ncbi:cohesin loading factor Ssl3 [Schizosaccharomyces cryophilus OY26]|uniref:Cohesin loading factor Ssl3 n=1 Tax=Schizosaccharomyces cryophilus (strain OY26 / ATCC MYA-4695 / CBS 11777 / NBRC 106824 / NRRL Y48691) TaxID=653667 RepID=S9VXM2_SCHCR|nr:cohesin loading factor Ssl3 [Schizosaccharomyces cryophilus OY26]EPY50745.1 cohesin loading factor Ssl3 [Schizosaccharomyces cryophilus OY26]